MAIDVRTSETCERPTVAAQRFVDSSDRYGGIDAAGAWEWEIGSGALHIAPHLQRHLGYRPDEVPPHVRHWMRRVYRRDRRPLAAVIRRHLGGDTPAFQHECRLLDRHDRPRWAVVVGAAERDIDGRPLRILGAAVDITAARRTELALRRRTDRLQAEAARLHELLQRASGLSLLGKLGSGVAHELAQPLGVILANAELLQCSLGGQPAEAADAVADILLAGRHTEQVLGRLRRMLRRQPGSHGPVDLNVAVHHALPLLQPQRRAVALLLELDPALPPVSGDAVQLEQVILNLALNALEAVARPARGRVLIQTASHGRQVVLSVCDNGAGADDAVLARMFEPLFSTKPQGLGLGLPVSREIVATHGGRLTATRNHDCGLTLRVILPSLTGRREQHRHD